jgi:hypothetical protein
MSSLTDLPEVVGFFSYSREDDEASRGMLSALRDGIQGELSGQLGRSKATFRLWQDQAAIAPGQLWESQIKTAIEQAVFFLPIVTPRAVNSHHCKFEFEAFLARERALGRADLVFPLLYIRVPSLEDEAQWRKDLVLSIIGERQYVDWRRFRPHDVSDPAVRTAISDFCEKIVDALRRPWVSPEERRKQEVDAARLEKQERKADEAARLADEEEQRRAEAARSKAATHRKPSKMANPDHLKTLQQGVDAWNAWRKQHPVEPALSGAKLSGAKLSKASLSEADLRRADLSGADLSGADLSGANLSAAELSQANLRGADLRGASFVDAHIANADLTGCRIYGVSAWNVKLSGGTRQQDLVITPEDEPAVTVDNIEVAQLVYLLLHNEKIRDVIDTFSKKNVLLLGRFTEGRIAVLERLRAALRERGYLPTVVNLDKPETKDFTETVRLLAGMSRFVIADITNPKSAPLELGATVPEIMVPFLPIIEEGEKPFATLEDLWIKHRDWVFEPLYYSSVDALVGALDEAIIGPAEARFDELILRKAEKMKAEHI